MTNPRQKTHAPSDRVPATDAAVRCPASLRRGQVLVLDASLRDQRRTAKAEDPQPIPCSATESDPAAAERGTPPGVAQLVTDPSWDNGVVDLDLTSPATCPYTCARIRVGPPPVVDQRTTCGETLSACSNRRVAIESAQHHFCMPRCRNSIGLNPMLSRPIHPFGGYSLSVRQV